MNLAKLSRTPTRDVALIAAGFIASWLTAGCGASVAIHEEVACGAGTAQKGHLCVAESAMSGGGTGVTASTQISSAASGRGGSGGIGAFPSAGGASGMGAASGSGAGPIFSGTLVPIHRVLRGLLIDRNDAHIYVLSSKEDEPGQDQVEDYSLKAGTLEVPIHVGYLPVAFDITPDGAQMYVVNGGEGNISMVDLASRKQVKKIDVPLASPADSLISFAIVNDRQAFLTTADGTESVGRMMSLDLGSDMVALRADFPVQERMYGGVYLKRSADFSTIAAIVRDSPLAPVFVYKGATDSFSSEHDLNAFIANVAVDAIGASIMVDGTYVLDANLNLKGTIPQGTISGTIIGATFGPDGSVAYRALLTQYGGAVEIVNPVTCTVVDSIPMVDTMDTNILSSVGSMAVTSDGKLLAVITDNGVSLISLQ